MSILNDNNTSKIKMQVQKQPALNYHINCDVVLQGKDFADATYMKSKPKANTKKLNKKEYLVLKSGEIKEYKEKAVFKRQAENLQRTFNNLRWLIRHNFHADAQNQLLLTLTYKQRENKSEPLKPMTDTKKLYKDFKIFMQALKRYMKGHKLDYLTVAEPQKNGSWHLHIMLKTNKPILFIAQEKVTELWGKGSTTTEKLKSDDIGTYYVAYFTDLIDDDLNNEETDSKTKSNARKKGERLKFYPTGFNFYRRSKGIQDPVHTRMTLQEIAKHLGEPTYSRKYTLEKEYESKNGETHTEIINEITKAWFKKNKEKKQLE